jgi:conjugative relaxase-like TrwC/TraI family protein
MLTISKPLSAGQAQTYHQKEFTAKEQNYWSQRGVIAGEWQGRLAEQLGLAGTVSAEDFAKLSQGQHPQTGEQLVRQRASYEYQDADGKTIRTMEHRAGWDATFSAPKSVSLTALVGGDQRVREAHRQSVRVALDQLERYTQARIGGNHPPETTGRFIAATFEHDTARPVDGYVAPQLHTHAVVFNITERDNGQPRAIQPQSLFASQQFATAIYQSELTYRFRQLGYEITTGRSGAPEIKGYTREYLDASSPRSQQIHEYLERTGRSGKEAAEIAAHSTRDRKEIHSPGEVMAARIESWRQTLGTKPTLSYARPVNGLNTRRSPSTRWTGFENLSPSPATKTSSARRLWMNVR